MQSTSLRTSSLFRLIVGFFILSCISQICNTFAQSPSFLRETLLDFNSTGSIDRVPILKSQYSDLPIDFVSTSFTSNGRILNGTIWLENPIYEDRHSEYLVSNLTFIMQIMNDPPIADYTVVIFPAPNETWTKVLYEHEPFRGNMTEQIRKPVVTEYNYTNFFVDGKKYIQFDLDLYRVGFPGSYWVTFRTQANKDGFDLYDATFSQTVPPRLNRYLFNWPENIRIKAGDEFVGKFSINSTQLQTEQTYILRDANETDGIQVGFNPPSLEIPKDGITTADLIIQTSPELHVANYTIPIDVEAITPRGARSNLSESFIAQIVPASSELEKFGNSLSRYSFYLSFIPIIATSIIALSLSRVIKTKSSVFANFSMTDLIAIDASIIVGVLFFLTIGSELSSGSNIYMGILTASIVYPFAISAIRAVIKGASGIRYKVHGIWIHLFNDIHRDYRIFEID